MLKRIPDALVWTFVLFLTYTLIHKLTGWEDFALNIAKSSLVRGIWVDILAYTAVTLEASCIILLVTKESIGLPFSLGVMAIFTGYITLLDLTGRYEICGCGGILNGLPFAWHFLINISIILMLALLIHYRLQSKKQTGHNQR